MFSSYVRLKYPFIERESKSTSAVVEVEGLGDDNDSSGRMGVDALGKHCVCCDRSDMLRALSYPSSWPTLRVLRLVTGRGVLTLCIMS